MVINKVNSFVVKHLIESNLSNNENNLHIQNAILHNSEGLHPVNKISDLYGGYVLINKVKAFYFADNGLMFRIYKELETEFEYDTIYLLNRDNKILFTIKFDECFYQKEIIQEGILFIDDENKII